LNAYILSNLGTPSAPTDAAVTSFLKEFLYDPAVIPLPALLRYPLVHWLIAPRRGKKSAEKYRAIWREDGSPLQVWSEALRAEVQKHVKGPVLLGMRYAEPSLEGALREAMRLGAGKIVLVPLYPQHADATSGSTAAHFRGLAERIGFSGALAVFPAFPKAAFFTKPLAEKIHPSLGLASHLLLTFHGLPVKQLNGRHCRVSSNCCELSMAEGVSCYRAHCLATAGEIARRLGLPSERWTIGFQSRFGKEKWLGPHTEDLLRELPAQGKTDLVVAAPSFVADCLETAEELGIKGEEIFRRAGGKRFVLTDCLNGDPEFAAGLAESISGV
jgi:ferrochelatase